VTAIAGVLVLALLGQAPTQRTFYWRDAAGQTHITNTPPPPGAEILETPPPPGMESGRVGRPEVVRQSTGLDGYRQVILSPVQQQAWSALDGRLAKARSEGDQRTLVAVADSLISDCLWGHGLWAMPAAPVLTVALVGFLGWWFAIGFRPGLHVPLVAGFLLLGLALGHLFLSVFLYHQQAVRLRRNLELLEQHLGTGKALRQDYQRLLQQRYRALEQAAGPLRPPWQFPLEVQNLRAAMKQVMVEP
jgi:hypothetical protein